MLRIVNAERVYPPETIAAMDAAFDQIGAFIPNSVEGDDMRRQLALIILRHVDRGVQNPERLSEVAFREFAALEASATVEADGVCG
jgi:hypothetical protein